MTLNSSTSKARRRETVSAQLSRTKDEIRAARRTISELQYQLVRARSALKGASTALGCNSEFFLARHFGERHIELNSSVEIDIRIVLSHIEKIIGQSVDEIIHDASIPF